MTTFPLTVHDLPLAVAWLVVGTVVGAVHFFSLRWNVHMLTAGRSLWPVVLVQLGRFAVMAVVLAAIARTSGAPALVATALGILAARTVIVQRAQREA